MLPKSTTLKFYKRKDIQEEMIKHAQNKEVSPRYGEGFGKRPDILTYPKEIIELAQQKATSFHASEEIWENPIYLHSEMTRKEQDELRQGWDLVLDIDCKIVDYSKICADLVIKFLKYCGVQDISVKFSVTGNTPILVKTGDMTKLISIKEVINLYKEKKCQKVLSMNKEGNVCFSKITGYLEHKEKIFGIYHDNSTLPINATKYHSVFVWENGNIIQKKVDELSTGDHLITFRNAQKIQRSKPIFEWEYQYLKKRVNRKIEITEKIMLLLGYYLAEGHITKTIHQVGFSFNVNETKYIDEVVGLLKELTGRKISIRHPNPNSTQILIHSKEWYAFFEKACGKGAKNKHVPSFSWSLPKIFFEELLLGYLRGDGHTAGEYSITAKSASHQLTRELVWLCKQNNISCSINQEYNKEHYLPQGTLFKGSHVYSINIPKSELPTHEFFRGRNKFSPFPRGKTFPIDGLQKVYQQVKPGGFNKHRTEQVTLNKKEANLQRIKNVLEWFERYKTVDYDQESKKIIGNYLRLYSNDLMALKVKKIVEKDEEEVFDISVEETERFFGGEYPVLLHNSGNKGFHIGVPFEAFPKQVGSTLTKDLFPEAPRKIAFYIKENIKEELGRRIMEFEENNFSAVKEKVELPQEEIIRLEKNHLGDPIPKLKVDKFLEIDTILLASRHLYRMPYSLHEKSGLVSLPIDPDKVMEFGKEMARPEKILRPMFTFLDREVKGESARNLLVQALDFEVREEKEYEKGFGKGKRQFDEIIIESPITEEYFPPCIQRILQGMEDGRKRSVFILMNFLGKLGWNKHGIEKFLHEWNKKNPASLREVYIRGQLNNFQPGAKLPPNCQNEAYYLNIGIKCETCRKFKNPVNYALWRWRRRFREEKSEKIK